ncbi:unnamed protein product [Clonostachys rosea]|uniref:Pyrroline-5-carboxylate reductase n=1 Tax=Bionectria ochroleuca TaxID=29856 RepID=A0ABY6UDX6_BIOOC|nr:unnamed protein product [Clonostachys rosea]
MAFVGCGNMGRAILEPLLDTVFPEAESSDEASSSALVSKFIACTKSKASAEKLPELLGRHHSHVSISHGQTLETMKAADVVVLGFKPYMADDVLGAPGVREALAGKLVISLLAGTGAAKIRSIIVGDSTDTEAPYVVKAAPNVAARFRQSMTLLETPDVPLPQHYTDIVEWIFLQIGKIKYLPLEQMNAGAMLMTASLAAMSIPLEGLLDGSVVEGLKRQDAMEIAIQGLRGFTEVLDKGTHPAVMRESISSPRGCTIQTILTVEKASTRAVFAQAMIDGSRHFK